MPDWLALALLFWNVHQPRRVGIGAAFVFGLLMDVHNGALFGEHALAYTLISYGAITLHRRMTWFPVGAQALHVLPLLLLAQFASLAVRMWVGGDWPGWVYFMRERWSAPRSGPSSRGCCSRRSGGRRTGTIPGRCSVDGSQRGRQDHGSARDPAQSPQPCSGPSGFFSTSTSCTVGWPP